jgi:EmrB/QacA subfamily drug resistance transporter
VFHLYDSDYHLTEDVMTISGRRRWWALFALVPAVLAVGLDVTVLSVALPTLADALHATTGELQWFVVAYSLVFAAAMVPGGMLGDRLGRKATLLTALGVFGLGSLACALSTSPGQLIASRVLLGLGAAVVVPMAMAVLPVLFTEQERPKALAAIMTATMLGFPIGPILGGWLLDHVWWGWVFLMNLPVVLLGLVSVAWLVPESRASRQQRFDVAGVLLSSAGLVALTYGVIEAGDRGWGDAVSLGWITTGVVTLTGFVLWERRATDPLVDLRLFGSRGFTWGTALATGVSFAMFGLMFAMPQYFQAVLGADAQGSGWRLLPLIGGLLLGAPTADRLAHRIGDGVAIGLGLALMAGGLAVGATTGTGATTTGTGTVVTAGWITLCGFGMGLSLPTAMDAALATLTAEHSGVGSAVVQALRLVGGSLGAAILGSVLNAGYHDRLHLAGTPAAAADTIRDGVVAGVAVADRLGSATLRTSVIEAYLHGMSLMLWTSAGMAALCGVLAVAFMPPRRQPEGDLTQTGDLTRTGDLTQTGDLTRTGGLTQTGDLTQTGGRTQTGEGAEGAEPRSVTMTT